MPSKTSVFPGLTGNQLKLFAMLTMTIDHIGFILLPQYEILRIIGRLSMPVYAFLIAEGCRYTRSRGRYLMSMAAMAAVCQVVSFIVTGTLYQCILVTFSMSISLIWLLERAVQKPGPGTIAAAAAGVLTAWFLCETLPALLPGTDYAVDYSFPGVLLPLFAYAGRTKWQKLGLTGLGLGLLCFYSGGLQWFAMAALIPLALYSGKRGKLSIKYLFYLYYPAHMAVLYLVAMFL